jgi:hypothetical protein
MAYSAFEEAPSEKKSDDVGFFESALAGVVNGVVRIPRGFVSLGAELYDLVGDANTAKEVENWFDTNLNPFSEEAEAQTVGKITRAVSQLGIPGVGGAVLGTKIGKLAQTALAAKKEGKFFSLAQFGSKIAVPAGTVVGAGLGEATVADEEIGTFADMLRGTSLEPYAITMMNIEEKEGREEAYRRLLNRVKFGAESSIFNALVLAGGKGISKLRNPSEGGISQYSENPFVRFFQKNLIPGTVGPQTRETFTAQRAMGANIGAIEFSSYNLTKDFENIVKEAYPEIEKQYLSKSVTTPEAVKDAFNRDVIDILTNRKNNLLDKDSVLNKLEIETIVDPNNPKNIIKKTKPMDGDLITLKDYDGAVDRSPKLKKLMNIIDDAGGDAEAFKNTILNMRRSVDNLSLTAMQKGLLKEDFETVQANLGNYLTTEYKKFNKLNPLKKYEPTQEQINKATDMLSDNLIKEDAFKKGINAADLDKTIYIDKAKKQVDDFLKHQSSDEANIINREQKKQVGSEIKQIQPNPGILKEKVLDPWQRELYGVINDPAYTFLATTGKQANLTETMKFLNKVESLGTKGKISDIDKIIDGKKFTKEDFIKGRIAFTEDELKTLGLKDDIGNVLKYKKFEPIKGLEGLTGLENMYLKAPIHDGVFDVTSDFLNRSSVGAIYKYAILAPKALSQVAKTVLSPITHARNFITASVFAGANGAFFPSLGDIRVLSSKVSEAYGLTGKRLTGTMTQADKELYERLLKVDVVSSNLQQGEIRQLFKDTIDNADQGAVFDKINNLGKKTGLSKVYGKIQDAYGAEDDFWKIINWNLERNRYDDIFNKIGINENNYLKVLGEDSARGKFLKDMVPNIDYASQSHQNFLDEVAGNLTRNQVPNYNYIGSLGKSLRLTPFGNFIAFPLEMLRTSNNIYTQSIKEITSGIPEIRALGIRRLLSFGTAVAALPVAATEGFKALNNVSDEELTALRRFVPEWSKNATLLPTGRDENGYLKYIDFSATNPYDVISRPFNTIFAQIASGKDSKESLSAALGKGLIDATSEILKPFTSESIFTEALVDSTIRRGIGRGGKRIWSEEDDGFIKVLKGITHLADSFTPGSVSQFNRLHKAVKGESDEYGKTFNLMDELPGLVGFRSVQSDPENGLKYKVTQFGSRLDKDRNLFSAPLLRGGRVTPEEIVNSYEYSESRRFQTMKDMYSDIKAARKLGVPNSIIQQKLKSRKGLEKGVIENIMKGRYIPDEPNKFFIEKMQEITNTLNQKEGVPLSNPYFEALPIINSIKNSNRGLNLSTDQIKVPKVDLSTGELGVENILPAGVNTTPTPVINNQVSSAGNLDRSEMVQALNLGSDYVQIAKNELNKPKQIVI